MRGELCYLAFHHGRKNLLLNLVSMFEEFLDDIIAEDIFHQGDRIGFNLSEHLFFLVAVRRLELLLDKTRAVLITAELNNVTIDILELLAAVPEI